MEARVSVIMAAYNCEETIRDSIDSILNQSYKDWELIICDDGSVDRTGEILAEYQKLYPRKIIVIQNNGNFQLPYSLNRCLMHAKGEFIARMDADDRSYEDRLEKQVTFLDEHPEIEVVGTAMTVFNGKDDIGVNYPPKTPGRLIIGPSVPFFHATIMMRKTAYDYLGGYSLKKSAIRCEDVELWLHFFGEGFHGANIQEPLYYVREDFSAVKRRKLKYAVNASITLFNGYRKYHYPLHQYVYIFKPIVSACIPKKIKCIINQKRWR
jgi:glycosyltransferase EpsE